jgi:hypothetical protein
VQTDADGSGVRVISKYQLAFFACRPIFTLTLWLVGRASPLQFEHISSLTTSAVCESH